MVKKQINTRMPYIWEYATPLIGILNYTSDIIQLQNEDRFNKRDNLVAIISIVGLTGTHILEAIAVSRAVSYFIS